MEIKPIETVYNGYRFRSRLEARWAVFFDEAEIPYEYEPEGFDVDGIWYLPDFFLPWFNCYVEIKPNRQEEIEKAKKIAKKFATEKAILLCVGLPSDDNITLFDSKNHWEAGFYENCWWNDKSGEQRCGYTKHYISLICKTSKPTNFLHCYADGTVDVDVDGKRRVYFSSYRSDFKEAKEAAKQARFEHGEKND